MPEIDHLNCREIEITSSYLIDILYIIFYVYVSAFIFVGALLFN